LSRVAFWRFGRLCACRVQHVSAIVDVVVQFLLQVRLGVEFQHLPHVCGRHERHFDLAENRIVYTDGQRHAAALAGNAKRFGHLAKMICPKFRRQPLFGGGNVHQRVIYQAKLLASTLQVDRLCRAIPQVERDDLVASLCLAVEEWQTHIVGAVEQKRCQGNLFFRVPWAPPNFQRIDL
jgi:hypothetical protein